MVHSRKSRHRELKYFAQSHKESKSQGRDSDITLLAPGRCCGATRSLSRGFLRPGRAKAGLQGTQFVPLLHQSPWCAHPGDFVHTIQEEKHLRQEFSLCLLLRVLNGRKTFVPHGRAQQAPAMPSTQRVRFIPKGRRLRGEKKIPALL